MSKITFHFQIPYPTFIENIIVYFLLRYRKKHYNCAFRRIRLTKGKFAIVDPEDYLKLAEYDWQCVGNNSKNYYAVRFDDKKIVYMHRLIMNAPAGKIVDHRDGEGLNNTRKNLRFATIAENNRSSTKRTKTASSKYKGVSRHKKNKKWRAYITTDHSKQKHLGYFDDEIEAAKAYDEAAKELYREYAKLNFG